MKRRSFLAGILGACTAPAFVRAESLMLLVPAQKLILPPKGIACLDPNGRVPAAKLPTTAGFDMGTDPVDAAYETEPAPWRYQWCADGVPIEGATSKTFTPRQEHAGKILTTLAWPANQGFSLL